MTIKELKQMLSKFPDDFELQKTILACHLARKDKKYVVVFNYGKTPLDRHLAKGIKIGELSEFINKKCKGCGLKVTLRRTDTNCNSCVQKIIESHIKSDKEHAICGW